MGDIAASGRNFCNIYINIQKLHEKLNTESLLQMFSLLEIVDYVSNSVIFKEKQSNSPHAMRPIFITMGKETISNLANVTETFF